MARHADLRWNKREADIEKIRSLQMAIMENVAGYLKDGGILVYSTCSLEFEENWFLNLNHNLSFR
jgi:16S rRNA (cytosine967-C5)-methyltransferase